MRRGMLLPAPGHAMITRDQAESIATEIIGPATAAAGRGWHLEEFPAGWFVREDWMSNTQIRGGSFCVVERSAGSVLAFPASIPPARIMTEYAQLAGRAAVLHRVRAAMLHRPARQDRPGSEAMEEIAAGPATSGHLPEHGP